MIEGIYLKLIAIGVAGAAVFGGAWSWRGSIATEEQHAAVDMAVHGALDKIEKTLDVEKDLRIAYQTRADAQMTTLMNRLEQVRVVNTRVSGMIVKDRADNATFYNQPLPPQGREAWIQARNLILATSSSPPASGPVPSAASSAPSTDASASFASP